MSRRKQLKRHDREKIYNRFGGHCGYCGCELKYDDMQVDHIQPLARGGEDCISNMMAACRSCNHYKSTLTVEKFRAAVEEFPTVLMRDSVTYRNAVRFGVVEPKPGKVKFYFETAEEWITPDAELQASYR